MSNYALLDSEYGEENVVKQPRSARATRGPHRYDGTIVNNKAVGYVPVTYEHAEYPRLVYHPKWGMSKEPDMGKFAIGCVTSDQFIAAHKAYSEAMEKWQRTNRMKLAQTEEDFERLVKKGWLDKPPLRKENPAFDMSSEEI